MKVKFGLEMGYGPVTFFVKLSLFLLYIDLFGASRRTRIFVHVGIASIFIVHTGITIVYGVFCIPKSDKSWLESITASRCSVPSQNMTYVVGSFGVISDFYILGVPMPVILRMQLPLKKKITVCALFLTGLLYNSLP